ncbi:MAG: glycosyltransferase family 2 protein [Phycisphaerae bacterium]|nr:glycosyltransferase family 2 protein [Tepidisphaeraceae bacterium]
MPIDTRNNVDFPRPAGSGESRSNGRGNGRARDTGSAAGGAGGRVPRVSVGLPVYNGAELLPEAVESILNQTYADLELVICDNASSDGTEAMCREYARRDPRVRYFRNSKNIGAAPNFNRTFELSRGPLFKWMAHDDVALPTNIERCVEVLDANPQVVLCSARRRYMDYDGRLCVEDPVESFHNLSIPQLLRLDGSRYPAYMMGVMRREVLARTRKMDTFVAADTVWVIEMRMQGELWEWPEELHRMRWPDKSAGHRSVRKTPRGEAIFLDPLNAARRFLMPPGIKLLIEMLRSVARSPAAAAVRRQASREIVAHAMEKLRRVIRPRELSRYVTQNVKWATQTLSDTEREHALGPRPTEKAHT